MRTFSYVLEVDIILYGGSETLERINKITQQLCADSDLRIFIQEIRKREKTYFANGNKLFVN